MTIKLDLDQLEKLATSAYSAVPYREGTGWHWSGHGDGGSPAVRLSAWRAGYGRCTVMDFDRWGMQGAQPRFPDDILAMRDARDLLTFEVGSRSIIGVTAAHADPSVYRFDVDGIAHPIPEYIAAAHPQVVLALIAEVRELRAVAKLYADQPTVAQAKADALREAAMDWTDFDAAAMGTPAAWFRARTTAIEKGAQ